MVDAKVLHHVRHHLGSEVRPISEVQLTGPPLVLTQLWQELVHVKLCGAHHDPRTAGIPVHEHPDLAAVQLHVVHTAVLEWVDWHQWLQGRQLSLRWSNFLASGVF